MVGADRDRWSGGGCRDQAPPWGFAPFAAWLAIAIGTSTRFRLHGLIRQGDPPINCMHGC